MVNGTVFPTGKVFKPQRSVRAFGGMGFVSFYIPEWFVHQEMCSRDSEDTDCSFCIIVA